MSLAADRPEFAPPPTRGTPRAVALALVAHVVLIAALTWGVHWKRDPESDAVEAEIWSTTVQQAARRRTVQLTRPRSRANFDSQNPKRSRLLRPTIFMCR